MDVGGRDNPVMQPPSHLAALRPLLDNMAAYLRPILMQSVTPIGAYQGDHYVQCGTGTLFRVADTSFLVTAAHVHEAAEERGLALCLFDVEYQGGPRYRIVDVPLSAVLHFARDPSDVA